MGQHALPSGSELRNIVFRDQILFVELDHGFQLTVDDCRFLILPDILAVFTLTGQIRLGKSCVTVGRDLCPEAFAVLVLIRKLNVASVSDIIKNNAVFRSPSLSSSSSSYIVMSRTS